MPGYVFTLAFIAVVATMVAVSARGHPPPDYMTWESDYATAQARARIEDKPILVVSYWEGGGRAYHQDIWEQVRNNYFANKTFASLLNQIFVCYREDRGQGHSFPEGFTLYASWGLRIMGSAGTMMFDYVKPPQAFYEEDLLPKLDLYKKISETQYTGIADEAVSLAVNQTTQILVPRDGNTTGQGAVSAYMSLECVNLSTKGAIDVYINDLNLTGTVQNTGPIELYHLWPALSADYYYFEMPTGHTAIRMVSRGFSGQLRCRVYVTPIVQ